MRLAILKDLNGLSFHQLIEKVPLKNGIPIFKRYSLIHNQKIVRHILKEWADQVLKSTKILIYKQGSKRDGTIFFKKKPVFLIDSVDLPLEGKSSTKTTDDEWAFKCNGPAQRYTFVTDGNGIPLKIWGGYSPKTYDGKFVEIMKYWFKKHLNTAIYLEIVIISLHKEN